jgi:hypothetical protein
MNPVSLGNHRAGSLPDTSSSNPPVTVYSRPVT